VNTLKDIAGYIKAKDPFILATHVSPEGDAFGSAIALSMALDAMGKASLVYDRDPVPEFYTFLPGWQRVLNTLDGTRTEDYNLILLDCNDLERAGLEGKSFKDTAVIDHHITERDFGRLRWIEPGTAAAGLMVYRLLKELGTPITKDIAVNLYTAIAVDTGIFRYGNTSPEALKSAAELVEAGAEPDTVAEGLYETWSPGRFMLFAKSLNTIQFSDGVAITVVTKKMFEETGTTSSDTENFPGYARVVKDIKVCALIKETDPGTWKVSLRSSKDTDVASVAQAFGGGGHRNASGCTIKADLETAKELLLKKIHERI